MRQLIAGLLAVVVGCGGDYSIELPNSYKLTIFSAYKAGILGPDNRLVVPPHVVEYSVLRDLVVGRVEIPKELDGAPSVRRIPGYFILDTQTGVALDSLSEPDWVEQLTQRGITTVPELDRPTMFDWH